MDKLKNFKIERIVGSEMKGKKNRTIDKIR